MAGKKNWERHSHQNTSDLRHVASSPNGSMGSLARPTGDTFKAQRLGRKCAINQPRVLMAMGSRDLNPSLRFSVTTRYRRSLSGHIVRSRWATGLE